MERNFRIEKEIELHTDKSWFDLKNIYFFHNLVLDADSGSVRLLFEGHPESGKPELIGKRIAVSFSQVSYFEFSKYFVQKINTELLRIGFKNPLDFDMDWLLSDEQSRRDDHILFCLGNDEFIRIYANNAEFERLDNSNAIYSY